MDSPDLSKLSIDRGPKSYAPRRKRRWINKWTIGLAALLAIYAVMSFVSARAPASVEVAAVTTTYPTAALSVLNATGRVSAWRKAAVSTKATGRLEWLGVQEGSRVKEGDVIARLENQDVAAARDSARANTTAARANLEQGEAELRDAESNYTRSKELFDKKFIAEAALITALAREEKAKASVSSLKAAIGVADANARQAEVALEQTLIRAPFDGIVLTKNANMGDIITPFSSATDSKGAVVNMADMDTLEVEADVSEASISKIKAGMPAEIQLDAYPDVRMPGKVSRIVPTVDRTKATLLVKVSFVEKDPRVLPDMSAKVAFLSREAKPEERKPVTAVRPEAVVLRGGKSVVFVVDEKAGTVKPVPVGDATKLGDLVQVSGVKAGDKVVLNPSERLADGAAVTIAKK
ncbi:MAG TPA: efflux RND transporter periplasmic adaptor subunit [Usitatibacter sp.]|nr:efflux RND transporter periplasmic adaptor subunit [Usitatibacter sp.]